MCLMIVGVRSHLRGTYVIMKTVCGYLCFKFTSVDMFDGKNVFLPSKIFFKA